MDSSCVICSRAVRLRQPPLIIYTLSCDFCSSLTHRTCTVSSECPKGWQQHNNSCYWASTSSAYSWNDAQTKCKENNAYLTEIGDHEENDFIARLTFGGGTWFFMGIVHKEKCGGWVKARNDQQIEYSNWKDSEKNIGNYACVRLGYLGYWETFPCDDEQYFICESNNYISSAAFPGYLLTTNSFQYNGHYYRTVGKKSTFEKAKEMCENAGAYLVEPDNEEENVYVHDKMHEAFYGQWRFIGGTDEKKEDNWVWGNKEEPITFTNWWPGEPNDKYGEDCMEMRYWGKWNDVDCYTNNYYICERPVNSSLTTCTHEEKTTEKPQETTEYYDY